MALSPEGQKHQKVRKNCFFFFNFLANFRKVVALCGAISGRPKTSKSVKKLFFFQLFGIFQKSGGTMWRYLRKAKNTKKCEKVDFFKFLAIFRKVVALCGAISGRPKTPKSVKKC